MYAYIFFYIHTTHIRGLLSKRGVNDPLRAIRSILILNETLPVRRHNQLARPRGRRKRIPHGDVYVHSSRAGSSVSKIKMRRDTARAVIVARLRIPILSGQFIPGARKGGTHALRALRGAREIYACPRTGNPIVSEKARRAK